MQPAKSHANRTIIVALTVTAVVAGLGVYGAITAVKDFKQNHATTSRERREKLAPLMPSAPASFSLAAEGYDPKANCFDKCGFEYRDYTFPAEETVCADVIGAILADKRGLAIENERDEAIDVAACNQKLGKVRQNAPGYMSASFYITASMRHMINDESVVNKTRFGRISIDLEAKKARYSVSQEYANYTFVQAQ